MVWGWWFVEMGQVTLKSMRFEARHGVLPEEKRDGNRFEVDITGELDVRPAADTDDLGLTFDYGRAHAIAASIMEGPSVDLIETLVIGIGDRIWAESDRLDALTVAVRKLGPPIGRDAAWSEVTHTWRR